MARQELEHNCAQDEAWKQKRTRLMQAHAQDKGMGAL